jgi:prepilin-type processing-associated H-X9-DG protein
MAALAGVVLPAIAKVKQVSLKTACAAQQQQIGLALQQYRINHVGRLPCRPAGLDQTNPHVFKYRDLPDSIASAMESAAGSRSIYYCPGNYQERSAQQWWPYPSGTVAVTYQFPFLLRSSLWQTRVYDYRRVAPDAVLAADYLGSDTRPEAPLAWNHTLDKTGAPRGMNVLLGDGHVEWRTAAAGWVLWGRSGGPINWYLAR